MCNAYTLALAALIPLSGSLADRLRPAPHLPARRTRAAGALASRHHAVSRPATIHRHLIGIGARLAHRSRKIIIHLPKQWPWRPAWQQLFTAVHATPPDQPAPLGCSTVEAAIEVTPGHRLVYTRRLTATLAAWGSEESCRQRLGRDARRPMH